MKKFELKKIVQESLQNICETARAEMSHRLKEDCGLDSRWLPSSWTWKSVSISRLTREILTRQNL